MTPTGRQPSNPPQFTAEAPPSTIAAPTSPPTRAWLELDGSPRIHVSVFQTTAPVSAAPVTATSSFEGTCTMPATVLATAAPIRSGPNRLKNAAKATAGSGRATRVDTRVAMALAASWNPFVSANRKAMEIARMSPVAIPLPRPDRSTRG